MLLQDIPELIQVDDLGAVARALERLGRSLREVVNGRIEFPEPYLPTQESGNIRGTYRLLKVDPALVNGPAFTFEHKLGDPKQRPRGWFPIFGHNTGAPSVILDQLLSSDDNDPLVTPGNATAEVDGVDPTLILGEPGVLDGWGLNGVLVGDEITIGDNTVSDDNWLTITEIIPGTPDTVRVSPATTVPLGTTALPYVIRRPPTETEITIRVFSATNGFVVATLFIF